MENIFTTVKPFLLLMNIFGLLPLTFEGSTEDGILTTTLADQLISLCKCLVWLYLIVANVFYFERIASSSIVIQNVYNISLLVGLVSVFVMFSYQWSRCKYISQLLASVKTYDSNVSNNRE